MNCCSKNKELNFDAFTSSYNTLNFSSVRSSQRSNLANSSNHKKSRKMSIDDQKDYNRHSKIKGGDVIVTS